MMKGARFILVLMSALLVSSGRCNPIIESLDPRRILSTCEDVSSSCASRLKSPSFSWNDTVLAVAYLKFTHTNKKCWDDFVHRNCWNPHFNKWKQGKCNLESECMLGYNELDKACEKAGGSLCNGTYEFGIAGSVVAFTLPSCAPKECHNDADMREISHCVNQKTCARLPQEVISACTINFGCFHDSKLPLYVTLGSIYGFIALFLILFGVTWSGLVSCGRRASSSASKKKKPKRVVNEERRLGGSQAGLLDGLGVNVPFTLESQTEMSTPGSEIFSPPPDDAPKSYVVSGTQSILNTQAISRASGDGANDPFSLGATPREPFDASSSASSFSQDSADFSLDSSSEAGDSASTELCPPKFKLSTQFERHIIKGFMFRRQELRGKGESGWGTGSTSASSLVWRSLFFKSKGNQILRGVSGYIKPGMCVACIGAPDSGASTLLRVLAGRSSGGKVTGEVFLDGCPPSSKMRKILAYIPKEDLNLPMLTVRETLEFSLNLRSPRQLPEKLRRERIDVVLSLLGLSHVADTIVGNQLVRGISGGEKRRVSLGVELVVGRSLLFASQPTNGLDSSAAYDVIKATRALSDTGLAAFMATVSQPSPELLALFDTVCMISRGTCIYFGPTAEAERFFFQQGFVRPPSKAVSDFLEEITGDAAQFWREEPNDQQRRLVRKDSMARQALVAAFRKSQHYKELGLAMWNELDAAAIEQQELEQELADTVNNEDDEATAEEERGFLKRFSPKFMLDDDGQVFCCGPSSYTTGFFYQLFYCLQRQIMLVLRSPTIRVRLFRAVFQGTLIGSMFFHLDTDQQGATSRFGLVFLSINSVVFGSMAVIPELFAQRQVYYCQRSAGYFRPLAYALALMLVEIPIIVVETMIYSLMVYSLCGLRDGVLSWNYVYFWATISVMQLTSWTMCFAVIMASPSAVVAQAICPTIIALFTLFCGYLVPRNQLFKPMRWLWDVSPISRSLKGLAINEVVGLSYYCKEEQLFPPLNTPNLTQPAPYGYNGEAYRMCPLASGASSLYMYDYNSGEQDKWVLFMQNLVFPAFFMTLLLVIMHTVHYDTDSSDSAGQLIEARREENKKRKAQLKDSTPSDASSYSRLEDSGATMEALMLEQAGQEVGNGSIEFSDLNYSVEIPRGAFQKPYQKQLLHDVSGYAEPGRIVALMGPSGAGKSTLLDVLADKKTGGHIQAQVLLINGRPRGPDYPRIAGYVEQMDSHLPTQTVREALEASALLRLPKRFDAASRKRVVDKVIRQLGLAPFENNLIGAPATADGISGVSPEVRKKTTIAVELVMDPSVLFLDEPTTGLDAASALAVMQAVRAACAAKATMCTIHQPSAEVFSLFDWILLLQTGGRVCYFGPVADMTSYFAKYGFGEKSGTANPADFALQCTRRIINEQTAADIFDQSSEKEGVLAQAPRFKNPVTGEEHDRLPPYAASSLTQLLQLLKTQFLFLKRDTALLKMRCSTAIIFGLIIGILFFDSKLDVAGAQARVALCFISVTYVGYSAMLCIPQMIDQRPVVFRERTSNMYKLVPYFLAITLSEIPFILLQNVCYIFTFYFMVGLRTEPNKFALFCFGMFMLNLACFAFSGWVATVAPNADAGTIINTVINSVFTLFCGFLLPFKSIPVYWKPLYYISMFRYPLAFLISNELHGRHFSCPNNERAIPIFVGGADPNAPPFPFGLNTDYNPACAFDLLVNNITRLLKDPRCFRYYCPVEDGDAFLRQYNFPTDEGGIWVSLSTLIGFYFLWRGLALVCLSCVQHIRR